MADNVDMHKNEQSDTHTFDSSKEVKLVDVKDLRNLIEKMSENVVLIVDLGGENNERNNSEVRKSKTSG